MSQMVIVPNAQQRVFERQRRRDCQECGARSSVRPFKAFENSTTWVCMQCWHRTSDSTYLLRDIREEQREDKRKRDETRGFHRGGGQR